MDSRIPEPHELENLKIDNLGECKIFSPFKKESYLYTSDDDKIVAYVDTKRINKYFKGGNPQPMFETAGPREKIFFNPAELNCGIVTCGGLCPGLNDVIRTIVLSLIWQYGANKVIGFRYGYEGLSSNARMDPMLLTPSVVEDIQNEGGTILGSSRGPQDPWDMVNTLVKYKIGILFALGGDGTFKGAHAIAEEIKKRKLQIAVVAIPKTIDNDIFCSERTFGFSTAVAQARESIYTAHEEAKAAWNGIGLVKLMGRDAGFIAVNATLSNSDVNFCLIPEAPFKLEGEDGFLAKLERRLLKRHHAVIVVGEGAGQDLIKACGTQDRDPSGNVKYKDIGIFLKDKIEEYLKQKNIPSTIKYIDPSYTIRSCRANADDSAFCIMVGQNAVHAAMAGKTDMFVGYWNHHFTHVPLMTVVGKKKQVNTDGAIWQIISDITK